MPKLFSLPVYRTASRLSCLGLLWMSACSPASNSPNAAVTAERLTTPTSAPIMPSPSPVEPEILLTPEGPLQLTVWWPDTLTTSNDDQSSLLLSSQVDSFDTTRPDIQVDVRLKKSQDSGGIMETLRTASTVAPSALPDVTLLRRQDLLNAVKLGIVQPVEERTSSATLGDLYPAALEMGRVDGTLYGLSYALEIEHIAYRPEILVGQFSHFDDVLADRQAFVFPANVTSGISDVLMLQYLSAGGTLNQLTSGRLNMTALRTVLTFYQDALAQNVIGTSVLNYAFPENYEDDLLQGKINAAMVTSSQYLELINAGQSWDAAPIPLQSGTPSTVLNGWMWVVVAKDSYRQDAAIRFIEWMSESKRQADFTQVVNELPSRRTALRLWEDTTYTNFADQLLVNARLPLIQDANNPTLQAMQTALVAVISGQRTADQAAQDVVNQQGANGNS